MERLSPIQDGIEVTASQLRNDQFEGVTNEQFLNFMHNSQAKICRVDDQVLITETLRGIVDILYPNIDKTLGRKAFGSMKRSIKSLEENDLVEIRKPDGSDPNDVSFTTSEDGMLNILSYIYARKEIRTPFMNTRWLVRESLGRTAQLWGDNAKAQMFQEALELRYPETQKKEDSERKYTTMVYKSDIEKEEIKKRKIEMALSRIPEKDDVFHEYNSKKIKESILLIRQSFPGWKLNSSEILLDRFPIPVSVIQAARFIAANDKGRFSNFRNTEDPVSVDEVIGSLGVVNRLIAHYEDYLSAKHQNNDIDIKLDLNSVYRVSVYKVMKDFGVKL